MVVDNADWDGNDDGTCIADSGDDGGHDDDDTSSGDGCDNEMVVR